jgi:hypothetical protein
MVERPVAAHPRGIVTLVAVLLEQAAVDLAHAIVKDVRVGPPAVHVVLEVEDRAVLELDEDLQEHVAAVRVGGEHRPALHVRGGAHVRPDVQQLAELAVEAGRQAAGRRRVLEQRDDVVEHEQADEHEAERAVGPAAAVLGADLERGAQQRLGDVGDRDVHGRLRRGSVGCACGRHGSLRLLAVVAALGGGRSVVVGRSDRGRATRGVGDGGPLPPQSRRLAQLLRLLSAALRSRSASSASRACSSSESGQPRRSFMNGGRSPAFGHT